MYILSELFLEFVRWYCFAYIFSWAFLPFAPVPESCPDKGKSRDMNMEREKREERKEKSKKNKKQNFLMMSLSMKYTEAFVTIFLHLFIFRLTVFLFHDVYFFLGPFTQVAGSVNRDSPAQANSK